MTNRIARSAAVIAVAAAALLTSACLVPPSPTAPGQTGVPAPSESEQAESPEPAEAPEPRYEIVAEGQDGSTWSFQVGEVRVVEADAVGDPAEPGHQLVEVTVDGQLLAGEPNFYRAFHMYLVDADGGEWGLSSGSEFYAEGDLFSTGVEPEFSGVGIYHVPAGLTFDLVRFTTDDGWTHDVQS